jgi:hypothetical protein
MYSALKKGKNKDINMKTRKTALFTVMIVGMGIVIFGWLAPGNAQQVSTSREYEVVVPEAKSDTQRVIDAYERLSDQFLSLVQSQLVQMATNNRDLASQLDRMEKKLDELSAKVDAMQKPAAPVETKAVNPAVPGQTSIPQKPQPVKEAHTTSK